VAVHDYFHPDYPGVAKAVDQWAINNKSEFTELESIGSMVAFSAAL